MEKAQKKIRSDADAPDPDTRHGAFNISDYTIPRRTESVPSVEPAASSYLGYATSMYHYNTPYPVLSVTRNILKNKHLLPSNMNDVSAITEQMEKLIIDSKAKTTWNKHFSAWNLYIDFCKNQNISAWPATIEKIRAFATWAVTTRKLKSSTVKAYISSLSVNNALCNSSQSPFFNDLVLKMILKGAENREMTSYNKTKPKLSLNPHMLKILGHRISESAWGDISKQVLWTALITCFFSSCRMGELVVNNEQFFDPKVTLKWENLKFPDNDSILLFIPFTKTKGFRGDFVDLFSFYDKNYCPVANLLKLKSMLQEKDIFRTSSPVFMLESGLYLTKNKINTLLEKFLSDTFDSSNFKVTCHSFRTSIPTLLASLDGDVSDIKIWGRWISESYSLYTKNVKAERRIVYDKFVHVLRDIWK